MVKNNYVSYLLKFKVDMDAFKEPDVPKMGLAKGTPILSCLALQGSGRVQWEAIWGEGRSSCHSQARSTREWLCCSDFSQEAASAQKTQVTPQSYAGRAMRGNALNTPKTSSLWQEWRLESGNINISWMDHLPRKSFHLDCGGSILNTR